MPVTGFRKPEYLSPSALDMFESDPSQYYRQYLSPVRGLRSSQTVPMSMGSAFDAFVKSYLHEAIFGHFGEDKKYERRTLFDAQVEEQNRQEAWRGGEYLFEQYKESGALADLMLELSGAIDDPRFEIDVRGIVDGYREGVTTHKLGVPLLGKPDLRFISAEGVHVIQDFKVNGFCGRGNTSPMAGYVQLLSPPNSGTVWTREGCHKNCCPVKYKGLMIDGQAYFEYYDPKWATQLATYGWLMGEDVGSETVVGIHQLACDGTRRDELNRPRVRIAVHSSRVGTDFQFKALARYQRLWFILGDEPLWLFRNLSREENDAKIALLDKEVTGNMTDEEWIKSMG